MRTRTTGPVFAISTASSDENAARPTAAPGDAGMSLPRLGKQLGLGVSVLMRALSAMGHARIGGVEGPGWVRVTQEEDRWTAALTEAGREFCARHLG